MDLSRFYDHAALQSVKGELLAAGAEYREHYKQAYRCLGAAGELRRNLTDAVDSEAVRQRLQKRARGIIAREIKKNGQTPGRLDQRFLSAVTHKGSLSLWDTVSAQAGRVYELADSYGLAHHLLSPILTAALAAGHDAVACPDPMAPERLAHLILPGLGLAFVTSAGAAPWPHRAYRRLRLDAAADDALQHASRPRLRFTRKVSDALLSEGVGGLARAKETHDRLEALYNPHVDFAGVYAAADRLADQLLSL